MKIKPIDNPQTKLKNRMNFGKKDETCPFCVQPFSDHRYECHFTGILDNNCVSWGTNLRADYPCRTADWLVCPFAVAIKVTTNADVLLHGLRERLKVI